MQKEDVLNVWFNQKLVGTLWQETSGKMGFQYEKAWIKEGFAISQKLPLTKAVFPAQEANARMHVVQDLKIADIDFALLKAIGGEFHPGKITMTHWERLAKDCNIHIPYLKKILQKTKENILDNLTLTKTQFEKNYGEYPALQRVEQVITKTCRKSLNEN